MSPSPPDETRSNPDSSTGDVGAQSLKPELDDSIPSSNDMIVPTETWRQVLGRGMLTASDAINENLIAARYATFASIVLLSTYGLAHTPLFFRFKTVSDIPASYFLRRRTIHGRLIGVVDNASAAQGDAEMPIVCLVRHLSPTGRLLNKSGFDFFMRVNPVAASGKSLEENSHELLRIEIAGAKEPPFYKAPPHAEQPGEWLRRLASERTPVACQLLSRRVRLEGAPKRESRALAEFQSTAVRVASEEQTAVAQIRYRPGQQILRTDLAKSLVRYGRASIASGMFCSVQDWHIVDTSNRVEDLKKDAKYIQQLENAEYEAAQESAGMWADPVVRDSRQDLIEEVTFQQEASRLRKIWRWLRGV